jgi:hypothetical protein
MSRGYGVNVEAWHALGAAQTRLRQAQAAELEARGHPDALRGLVAEATLAAAAAEVEFHQARVHYARTLAGAPDGAGAASIDTANREIEKKLQLYESARRKLEHIHRDGDGRRPTPRPHGEQEGRIG